jgi:hypothetical protein
MNSFDQPSLHQCLRESIIAGDTLRQNEYRAETTIWRDFGTDTTDYTETFAALLNGRTFTELIGVDSLVALDLAAPIRSFLAKQPEITTGITVTLADSRTSAKRQEDDERHLYTVEGHLLRRQTWRMMTQLMHANGIECFHLITCRPFAGILDDIQMAALYYGVLDRAVKLLCPTKGVLLTEVPDFPGVAHEIERLIARLNTCGMTTTVQPPQQARQYGHRYCLMIKRTRPC